MPPALARLRFPVEASRGRRYPEPDHLYRNSFQRDRDRIIHTRAFRRLEDKTQVFPAGISDHFRNRLTHTLEVSQIARTVAAALGLDEQLTEALALAHDFGHPPFAHAGEMELDRQMRRFGDRFNHNLHALRIVEHFENPYARFPGLNLTFELREGIVKHSMDFVEGQFPELDAYLPGKKPPIEAQLIDIADEIAYNTADLDDGFSAGLFTKEDISQAVPAYAEFQETIGMQFPGATPRVQFLEILRMLVDHLVSGLIEGTAAAAAQMTSVDEVRDHASRLASISAGARATNSALKTFLHSNLYNAPELQREREESAHLVNALFAFFLDHPERMPEPYASLAAGQPRHRVVCDYIAGMTDGFFRRTAAALLGPSVTI
jgi:dGTPase